VIGIEGDRAAEVVDGVLLVAAERREAHAAVEQVQGLVGWLELERAVEVADRGHVIAESLVREAALGIEGDFALAELIVELDGLAEAGHGVLRPALLERAHAVRVQRGEAAEQSGYDVHRAIRHPSEDGPLRSRRKARH
jgi:hypothetical protein